jgi:hypothetical protein
MTARARKKPATAAEWGAVTFGPADAAGDITAKSTVTDWTARAESLFVLSRVILPILNGTDAEIEAMVVAATKELGFVEGVDAFATLAENVQKAREWHETGRQIMQAAELRLVTVLSRFEGDPRLQVGGAS